MLEDVIEDILQWNISRYDVKKLAGYEKLLRIRVWKIRIVFEQKEMGYIMRKIDTRWDVYKNI